MNYRHAFHAGNFADVHKHVVLLALLERLKQKPKPLFYLDTHAGRGGYDLRAEDATRGGEWREGIARLAGRPVQSADLRRYLQATHADRRARRRATRARRWSRSAPCARAIARCWSSSRPAEAQALKQATRGRRDVAVVCGDGYAALKTYLPPRENRGLVLIDPPYEADNEFADVERALQLGLSSLAERRLCTVVSDQGGRAVTEVERGAADLRVTQATATGADGAARGLADRAERLGARHREPALEVRRRDARRARESCTRLWQARAGRRGVRWLVPE